MIKLKQIASKYLFIIIAILFAAILAYFFLRGEKLNLSKGIEDQKVTNYFVTLFTMLGTIAAVYYTYKQYNIANKQLEISNKHYQLTEKTALSTKRPSIAVNREEWFRVLLDNSVTSAPGNTLKCIKAVNENDEDYYKLEIRNDGLGIAKNISFNWEFDIEKANELIKNCYYVPLEEAGGINILRCTKKEIFYLPTLFVACCGPKVLRKYNIKSLSNTFDSNISLPKLSLKISFTDLHGTPDESHFKFEVTAYRTRVNII